MCQIHLHRVQLSLPSQNLLAALGLGLKADRPTGPSELHRPTLSGYAPAAEQLPPPCLRFLDPISPPEMPPWVLQGPALMLLSL